MNIVAKEALGLVGQSEAEQTLLHAWRSGRLHHAWLLTGPPGTGKSTLAHRFARAVLTAPMSRDIAFDTTCTAHPDLLVISRAIDERRQRTAGEIVLEDVRPAHVFLRRTAAKGGWRVVIVDGADHLNRSAANAMLKLIEEPPRQALILLVCDAPGRLLPTLRSRCRRLRLVPLDDTLMNMVLERLLPHLSQSEREALIPLSNGSPGRALSLAAAEGIALSGLVDEVLSRHERPATLWAYDVADAVLRHESGFATFVGLLSNAISSAITDAIRLGTASTEAFHLRFRPAHKWAAICVDLARLREETESLNLDKREAMIACLSLLSD